MELSFGGEIIEWRGPSPYYFVRVPDDLGEEITAVAAHLTYGWGVIPVTVTIGGTTWTTSLFPKDGSYLVPVKLAVRRRERLDEGDTVELDLSLGSP